MSDSPNALPAISVTTAAAKEPAPFAQGSTALHRGC